MFIRRYFQKLAEITGSRAYERFTGPQISKIYKTKHDAYSITEVIIGIC